MIHECHMNVTIVLKDTRARPQKAIQQYAIVTCIGLSFNVRKVELNQVKWFFLVLIRRFEASRIDLKAHVMTASSNVFDIVDGLIVYCVRIRIHERIVRIFKHTKLQVSKSE